MYRFFLSIALNFLVIFSFAADTDNPNNFSNKLPVFNNLLLSVPAPPASITIIAVTPTVCGEKRYRFIAPNLPTASTNAVAAKGYLWSFVGSLTGDITIDTSKAVIDSGNINSRIIVVRFKTNNAAATGDSVRLKYNSDIGYSRDYLMKCVSY